MSFLLRTTTLVALVFYSNLPAQTVSSYQLKKEEIEVIRAAILDIRKNTLMSSEIRIGDVSTNEISRDMLPPRTPFGLWPKSKGAAQAAENLIRNNQSVFHIEPWGPEVLTTPGFPIYVFSRPGFDSNQRCAFVLLGVQPSSAASYGRYFMLQKKGNVWQVVASCISWES